MCLHFACIFLKQQVILIIKQPLFKDYWTVHRTKVPQVALLFTAFPVMLVTIEGLDRKRALGSFWSKMNIAKKTPNFA